MYIRYHEGRDDLLRAMIDITTGAVLGARAGLLDDLDSFAAIDRWVDDPDPLRRARNGVRAILLGART